jgi:NADH-quinone oxidoreductase subunit M
VVLAALYLLWAYQRVFHGPVDEPNADVRDMSVGEGLVMAPLLALIIVLGVYPGPVLERIEPAVEQLVEHIEEHTSFDQPDVARVGAAGAGEESE